MKHIPSFVIALSICTSILYASEKKPFVLNPYYRVNYEKPKKTDIPLSLFDVEERPQKARDAIQRGHLTKFKRIIAHPCFAKQPKTCNALATALVRNWVNVDNGRAYLIRLIKKHEESSLILPEHYEKPVATTLGSPSKKIFERNLRRLGNLFDFAEKELPHGQQIIFKHACNLMYELRDKMQDTPTRKKVHAVCKRIGITDADLDVLGVPSHPLSTETQNLLNDANRLMYENNPICFMELLGNHPYLSTRLFKGAQYDSLLDLAIIRHMRTGDRSFYIHQLAEAWPECSKASLNFIVSDISEALHSQDASIFGKINTLAKLYALIGDMPLRHGNGMLVRSFLQKKMHRLTSQFDTKTISPEQLTVLDRLQFAVELEI